MSSVQLYPVWGALSAAAICAVSAMVVCLGQGVIISRNMDMSSAIVAGELAALIIAAAAVLMTMYMLIVCANSIDIEACSRYFKTNERL